MSVKKIIVCSQKGGSSKSSSVGCIASVLEERGYNCLLCDLDGQGNLSDTFGIDPTDDENSERSIVQLFENDNVKAKDIIQQVREKIYLIPSNLNLTGTEFALSKKPYGIDSILKKKLSEVENDFDFILYDAPPNLGIFTINGIASAEYVLIPMEPGRYGLTGMKQLISCVDDIKQSINPNIKILGIFLSRFKSNTKMARDMYEYLTNEIKLKIFETKIRECTDIAKAQTQFETVIEMDKTKKNKSKGTIDYNALVDEILAELKV